MVWLRNLIHIVTLFFIAFRSQSKDILLISEIRFFLTFILQFLQP